MSVLIDRILLFSENGNKREVEFGDGLNIITGQSKSGKSAIIEIIDYCLFKRYSTIPKGKITDFAKYFVTVFKLHEVYIVVARPGPYAEEDLQAGMVIERDLNRIENYTLEDIEDIQLRPLKQTQHRFESYIGLAVDNTSHSGEDVPGKASVRNMTSYIFQHQNLIASKHALFYRFDDYYRKQRAIEEFPIFMGWADSTYYALLRALEEKERELKFEEKLLEKAEAKRIRLASEVRQHLNDYLSIVGGSVDPGLSIEALYKFCSNLPDIPENIYLNNEIFDRLQKLKSERNKLSDELFEVKKQITLLDKGNDAIRDYGERLRNIDLFSSDYHSDNNLTCPFCQSHVEHLEASVKKVIASRKNLLNEIKETSASFRRDDSSQLMSLVHNREVLSSCILNINGRIASLEKQIEGFKQKKDLREKAIQFRTLTEANIKELLIPDNSNSKQKEITKLKNEILSYRKRLNKINVASRLKEANVFLSKKMTTLCGMLDFEEELLPAKPILKLDDNFKFYVSTNRYDNLMLSEMGSGANWLACHISVFLSILYLNCSCPKSVLPKFLVIDQPSQIYFPKGQDQAEDNDLKQAANIFDTIIKMISTIQKYTPFTPQVIVTEHADCLDLKQGYFEEYVVARWDKTKLI